MVYRRKLWPQHKLTSVIVAGTRVKESYNVWRLSRKLARTAASCVSVSHDCLLYQRENYLYDSTYITCCDYDLRQVTIHYSYLRLSRKAAK